MTPWWRVHERGCAEPGFFPAPKWRGPVLRLWAILLFSLAFSQPVTVALAAPPAPAQTLLEPAAELPRVIRYVSSLPQHQGETCYGLVLVEANGIPVRVRALSDLHPQLCYAGEPRHPQPQLLRWAFAAADAVTAAAAVTDIAHEQAEDLDQDRLAEQVLPPVGITAVELDSLQRFAIGVGLNYAEHREEVGTDEDEPELLLFPKPVGVDCNKLMLASATEQAKGLPMKVGPCIKT